MDRDSGNLFIDFQFDNDIYIYIYIYFFSYYINIDYSNLRTNFTNQV